MSHDELKDLAPIYALGALDGEDLSRFQSHLDGCSECRALVAEHEQAAASLAYSLPETAPSPEVKRRIERVIRRRPVWLYTLAAAAAVVMVAMLSIFLRMNAFESARDALRGRPGTVTVKVVGTPALPGIEGTVYWNGREIAFESASLPVLPPDKKGYELWVIVGGKPQKAGFFARDDEGRVRGLFELAPVPSKVEAFAVTREAALVESPTMPIVAMAPVP